MSDDKLCSRGVYGCRHDEGHIPTRETVLQFFTEHNGYVLSRDLWDTFGRCTEERIDEYIAVISHLQYVTKEIAPISASAWGLVGAEHPKVQTQKRFIFRELPPGKIHLAEDSVMIHDRDGALLYDYVTTDNETEVTCGLCRNILKARAKK